MAFADGEIDGHYRPSGRKLDGFNADAARLVVEVFHQPATQAHHSFGCAGMPMDGKWTIGTFCAVCLVISMLRADIQILPVILY